MLSHWLKLQKCENSVVLSGPIFLPKMLPECDSLEHLCPALVLVLGLHGFGAV